MAKGGSHNTIKLREIIFYCQASKSPLSRRVHILTDAVGMVCAFILLSALKWLKCNILASKQLFLCVLAATNSRLYLVVFVRLSF
jgi:hypothetical protein